MSTNNVPDARTRWGRANFAGGRIPALAVAIPAGILLAAGAGALTLVTKVAQGENAMLIAGVTALVMSWGLIGLVWALIVDRSTLRGAVDKPDESVESKWLDTAMAGALGDTITLTGITLAVIALADITFDAMCALIGVIVVAVFSTLVRYLMARKRG